MNHRGRWRIGALASAIALLGSLASLEAHALSLGKITIQSALGEPLQGEIDITDINPAEASSLKVGLASAETFMAAGMDYPSSATGLEVKLLRRADGRPYLRLNSSRAITEPFMDLIVEANWASGHVTRDYTMLFDPPRAVASSTPPIIPTVPMLSRPAGPVAAAVPVAVPMADLAAPKTRETPDAATGSLKTPAQPTEHSDPPPERAAPPAERAIAPAERPVPPPAAATTVRPSEPAKTAPDDSNQVLVKRGDTATKIAARNKPADVSLDQMLVALLKQNPNAFIGGNVNTIKSGAVLDMPKSETVSALSPTEAHKIIVAQSRDFNAFRRKLSESVSSTPATSPDRQSGGKLQTEVEDHAQTAPPPDKLTLSHGAVQAGSPGKSADTIAKGQQAKNDALRVAELNKNISDLNKLGVAPATAAPASRSAAVPAITVATPPSLSAPVQPAAQKASAAAAPLPAPLPAASAAAPSADAAIAIKTPASAASAAEAALATASAPATQASAASTPVDLKKPAVKALPPPPEPELMDQLMENAVPLLGGVGILGLLGGLVFMRRQKKKSKTAPVDSSFLESRLQPDSFFGASGGSRVNTNGHSLPGGSSMAYTPSQMDASGDVDPVAEADVYLAYGRDEQAEDILKEALHTHPGRAAIHAKLLEIYAKRRDKTAFENLAGEALKLTQGQGPEWAYIIELGNELDPGNALYQAREAAPEEPPQNGASTPAPASAMASAPSADMDLDLDMDMDFSLDDEAPQASAAPVTVAPVPAPPAPVIPAPAPMPPVALMTSPASATPPASSLDDLDLGLDFDMTPTAPPAPKPPAAAPAAAPAPAPAPVPDIDLLSSGLDFTPMPLVAPQPAAAPKPAAAAPAHDNGMMEFDLDAFSLDLSPAPAKTEEHAKTETQEEDPLEVKFMLAEEFRALGDTDGARSLADEVVAKAKGPLKTKAQSFLNELA